MFISVSGCWRWGSGCNSLWVRNGQLLHILLLHHRYLLDVACRIIIYFTGFDLNEVVDCLGAYVSLFLNVSFASLSQPNNRPCCFSDKKNALFVMVFIITLYYDHFQGNLISLAFLVTGPAGRIKFRTPATHHSHLVLPLSLSL